ncbi:15760_t:CDS:2 [Acaulospora morrowiae]|uniref:15760_t:CDS:1 n=1 Tax=Acaulospora morrowiae TaxID=94023 RepID=A0A9N9NND0_9GLOM|nr:15760_t:CDS:2 [Acaulospora morrowiae]
MEMPKIEPQDEERMKMLSNILTYTCSLSTNEIKDLYSVLQGYCLGLGDFNEWDWICPELPTIYELEDESSLQSESILKKTFNEYSMLGNWCDACNKFSEETHTHTYCSDCDRVYEPFCDSLKNECICDLIPVGECFPLKEDFEKFLLDNNVCDMSNHQCKDFCGCKKGFTWIRQK